MKNFNAGTYVNQGHYNSFQPNKINRLWQVDDMEILALLSKADRMLGRLDMYSEHVPNINLFINMHVVKEATQSTKIEGTQTNMGEALLPKDDVPLDKRDEWTEVQNYIKAMHEAVKLLDTLPFSSRFIRSVHKTLVTGVRGADKQPGEFRRIQNWIGGNNITDAVFVPPVHTSIPELIEDIELFVHNEHLLLPDLLKIALIHYQFETIHPFLDGNGRTGRLLITLYLVSKGILKRPILYLSDYLENHRNSYYAAIMKARTDSDLVPWFRLFLEGVIATAESGVVTFGEILNIQKENDNITQAMGIRSANAQKVVAEMYKTPIIDAATVSRVTGLANASTYSLITSMIECGLLQELTSGTRKRKRLFVMKKYVDIFDAPCQQT